MRAAMRAVKVLAVSQSAPAIGSTTCMPLPPESLTKLSSLSAASRSRISVRGGDDLLPGDALARIEIEHDAIADFQSLEPRAADVNLERAGLHQRDQIVELLDRDDIVLLGIDDMAQRRLLDVRAMCF